MSKLHNIPFDETRKNNNDNNFYLSYFDFDIESIFCA